MKKNSFPSVVMAVVVASALAILSVSLESCKLGNNGTEERGFLEGRVTIGPLCPAEPCYIPPEQRARIYAERKILIYTQDRRSVVTEVSLDENGSYWTELNPGKYVADINRVGVDSSDDVPKEIEIEPGRTIKLDIDIDTGVR